MLIRALGDSLPMAVGIGFSPLPIAAVLMLLMTARGRTNAPLFLAGWILGIVCVGSAVILAPGIETERGDPTPLSGWIRIVLGLLLLGLALGMGRGRSRDAAAGEPPALLRRIDSLGPVGALVAGVLLSAVQPKNLPLVVAGAVRIDASTQDLATALFALLGFAGIASLAIAVPIALQRVSPERSGVVFAQWKDWLVRNNAVVTVVLLIAFGALLVGRGLRVLGGGA